MVRQKSLILRPRSAIAALLCVAMSTPAAAQVQPRTDLVPQTLPGTQYIYGSGEGLAISEQAYSALTTYVRAQMALRPARRHSVLFDMAAMKTTCGDDIACMLAKPTFAPCRGKPSVIFDADETLLLNLGFERDAVVNAAPYIDKHWADWERTGSQQVAAVPGAVAAIARLRAMGVDPVIISNRDGLDPADFQSHEDFGAYAEQALDHAGLTGFHHGRNLILKFDDGNRNVKNNGKDARRAALGKGRCVIAMVGDQLGDFSDLFARPEPILDRRSDAARPSIARLWGNGWFLLPNPLYGSAVPPKTDASASFPPSIDWPKAR